MRNSGQPSKSYHTNAILHVFATTDISLFIHTSRFVTPKRINRSTHTQGNGHAEAPPPGHIAANARSLQGSALIIACLIAASARDFQQYLSSLSRHSLAWHYRALPFQVRCFLPYANDSAFCDVRIFCEATELIGSLPSNALTQDAKGSCDENGLAYLAKRYPPMGVSYSKVSRSGSKYTWTISGQEYGNGQYVAEASSVMNRGLVSEWPASGAFDHRRGNSGSIFSVGVLFGGRTGWHTGWIDQSSKPIWLRVELPEAIRLRYYTMSSRSDCCEDQFPEEWVLSCVDNPNLKVTLDSRSGQSIGVNQCIMYPAPDISCRKFEFSLASSTALSEVALYEGARPTTITTTLTTTTTTTTLLRLLLLLLTYYNYYDHYQGVMAKVIYSFKT